MPTKNPRINVVLEKPLYDSVRRLAEKEDVSLSLKIRDLVRAALEAVQAGVRAAIASLRSGRPFYYLPDQDYGARDSVFVPFFGVPAATVTGLSRLARITGARVLPCLTRILPGGAGYEVTIEPPWESFPSADPVADTRRMNEYIERRVLEMPEQYLWMHKRFKTRPPGEARFY